MTDPIGSIIMAAGRGSRMKGFQGSKTLLPLAPMNSPFQGNQPILLHILGSLPAGPKALIVSHEKESIMEATRYLDLAYLEQPVLNGTGGALLAARPFLESAPCQNFIITMGDVPLVRPETYLELVHALSSNVFVVLGFRPRNKRQYGALAIREQRVKRIVEWKYWHMWPQEEQALLDLFNSGIYAARREALLKSIPRLASRPHTVVKERNGNQTKVEEFFITDLVEIMEKDRCPVGFAVARDEEEVMGVDDLESLLKAQEAYKRRTVEH
ncbi:MAG: NTP transferase domain-containing protein [Desulfatiglandales bacterium]|jgi:bifunctional UDP-N-acetylglucosamine pyrophosphorylase / glucosamine-1-phosphate N-acetyltransferase